MPAACLGGFAFSDTAYRPSSLGRVFSSTSRVISALGMSRRFPNFTLATLPSYAHRRQVQRLTPVSASASATPSRFRRSIDFGSPLRGVRFTSSDRISNNNLEPSNPAPSKTDSVPVLMIVICCLGFWCPCILFGHTRTRFYNPTIAREELPCCTGACCGYATVLMLCAPLQCIFGCMQRGDIRTKYEIEGNGCVDCLAHTFCDCCVCSYYEFV